MGGRAKLRTSLAMAVLLLGALAAPANGAIRLSLDGVSFAPEDVNITDNATVGLYVIAETWGDVSYYIYMTTGTGIDYNDMDWATSNIYGSIAQPVASANAGELAQVLDANGWYLQAESIPAQPPEIMDGIHFVTSVTAIGNAGESFTVGITDPNYEYIIGDCLTFNIIADTTQPSPDPMVWATPPYATGAMSIRMVATTASDPAGVEYYFECTASGGHDSGWQDGTLYEDIGLIPNAQYTYRVKARDKSGNHNETGWSVEGSATTSLEGVIYVDDDASPGGTGLSWETAYKYLQDALGVAVAGDEIWVAEGTYKPDQDEDDSVTPGEQTETFRLINDVAIYGGFPSTGAGENRDPNAYETILSGDLNGDDEPNFVNNDENSYHVTTASDTNETAVLDGFTITAGNAWGDVGGGMYNERSKATVRNCKFNSNEASGGGGMFNYYYSNLTLINCAFTGNSAGSGGGMYNDGSNPELVNCTFSGNVGGGMYNGSSSPTMTNCTFNGNTANYGGGMLNELNSSPVVNGCTFTSNTATNNGGGMLNEQNSNPTLDNCTFTGNEASIGGGMCNESGSSPTVTNCVFTNGSAGTGGGMYNNKSDPELVYCTFSENLTGGGMYNENESSPTVTRCTFSGNATGGNGGGMYNSNGSSTVIDCNFEGNWADQFGGGMYDSNSSPTVTNCIFSENSTGEDGGGMHNESVSSPTVTDCAFSGNTTGGNGGGMYNHVDSSPTVMNCTFSGNSGEHGGGMYNYSSSPTLTGCTFSWNPANWGGGMYNYGSSPTLTGCTFSWNPAGTGGGMYNYFGSPTLDVCTFIGNLAPNGGGMVNDQSSPTMTYCTFSGNSAMHAGGMYNLESSPKLTNCSFSGNWAYNLGGGMCNYYSNPMLTKCTFSGNLTGERGHGGGIYNDFSDLTLTNCTFRANSAFCGGGMCNYYYSSPMVTNCVFSGNEAASVGGAMHNGDNSRPILTNCTFSGNSADGGGGIYNDFDSDPNIANCVLWGNNDSGGYGESAQIYNLDSTPVVNYCCVEGWTGALGGTGNIGDDPLFKDADGEDDIVGTQDDDLHLTAYSPCIDAGDNNSVPADTPDLDGDGNTGERTPLDLARNARFTDDPVTVDTGNHAPGYPKVVEMGAYERYEFCGSEVYPYPPGDVSGPDGIQDCYIDFFDFAVWAAHWLEYTGPE